ncbi:Cof-type HAD-IIB family hydrolase [Porcipelethomonas sp.]|uniref:Cof-type HAD-IIB family hydrolase n=1 Tax=Porcipelethomonas sp. TaxID=2981675 RepID=UPI003EF1CF89
MKIIKGTSVSRGIAFGNIVLEKKCIPDIIKISNIDPVEEINRFFKASADTLNHLQYLYERTLHIAGETYAQIFSIQQMMLQDGDFVDTIIKTIETQNVNAEYAVYLASGIFSDFFMDMDDESIRSKSNDILDVSGHIIRHLNKETIKPPVYSGGCHILAADGFLPSQIADIDRNIVSAVISAKGLARSHAAYLARHMQIPAVINTGIHLNDSIEGKYAAVDGFTGEIFIEPDEKMINSLKKRQSKYSDIKRMVGIMKDKMNFAKETRKIQMIALDLDGTIISNGSILSEKSAEAIEKAAASGVVIAVCTGRVLMEIPEEVKKINGIQYFITSNGAAIYDSRFNCIYEDPLPEATADKAIEILDDYNCLLDLYVGGHGYVQADNVKNIEQYKIGQGFHAVLQNNRILVEDIHDFYYSNKPDIEKINLFFADLDERSEAIGRLSKLLPPPNITYSMGNNLEVNSGNCCKGQGVHFLSGKLSINPKNIMTIGDSNNDISMLEYAGCSVAMGNAPENVKSAAKYITSTCENDGAAEAIEKYALI